MVRCNLSVLLAERGLKITKVSKDTGISRTTLTALSSNTSQGIQFETLNTLCLYLKIHASDLISFVPVNLSVKDTEYYPDAEESDTVDDLVIHLELFDGIMTHARDLWCETTIQLNDQGQSESALIYVQLFHDGKEDDKKNELTISTLQQLPQAFLSDLEKEIETAALARLKTRYAFSDDFRHSFSWHREFGL